MRLLSNRNKGIYMNGVFLDYTSLDKQDLDMQALRAAFDALTLYPLTSADVLLERVADAEVIITNKVVINAETIRQCPQDRKSVVREWGCDSERVVSCK